MTTTKDPQLAVGAASMFLAWLDLIERRASYDYTPAEAALYALLVPHRAELQEILAMAKAERDALRILGPNWQDLSGAGG